MSSWQTGTERIEVSFVECLVGFGGMLMRRNFVVLAGLLGAAVGAFASERVTLKNGFAIDCTRHEVSGETDRLFFGIAADAGYMDVPVASVVRIETVPDAPLANVKVPVAAARLIGSLNPTAAELHELLARAGEAHRIDAELLASVVHAESAGHARAVSRTGARGLMQLMPGTAAALGVHDAFVPAENVEGGTKYLDQMLTRYHDNVALALAAYNAGPGAVDRWHGVPPYRETQIYVSRIIREFNQRKTALLAGTMGK